MYEHRDLREIFHYSFLERLAKTTDPGLYVLKGGVNLRFFFNSPRYSEDMDLDVLGGNVGTLKKNGYKILQDASLLRGLRVYGIAAIEMNDPAKAKHTETTQRFRAQLVTTSGDRLPTKIEFSRRSKDVHGVVTESINANLARHYRRLSFAFPHYDGETAVLQKVRALAGRPVTQARDVFDLAILRLGGYTHRAGMLSDITDEERRKARDCLLSLTYADYAGQVLEFLSDEDRVRYGGKSTWAEIQQDVLDWLNHDA